jgi:putative transposase
MLPLLLEQGPVADVQGFRGALLVPTRVFEGLLGLEALDVQTLFIAPDSPWENGYVESFNGKLRDELLARETLETLAEARTLIARWRRPYKTVQPHSALGYHPPAPEAVRPVPMGGAQVSVGSLITTGSLMGGRSGEWSLGGGQATDGTCYVEGPVSIGGSPGSNGSPALLTIIAAGSIDISGSPDIGADTPELLFVTDGDLEISGGLAADTLTLAGQILVHEQVKLSGNPALGGQLLIEDATSVDDLVTVNEIGGSVVITYDGGRGIGSFGVAGWRNVQDAS